MKKKVFSLIMTLMVALSLVACGSSSQPAAAPEKTVVEENKADTTPAVAEDKEEVVVPEKTTVEEEPAPTTETVETVVEEDDFTILDVTTELVDVGIYAVDDSNTEYVITLFRDPSDNSYISLMAVAEDGSGDLICGAYDDSCITLVPDEENGVDWTVFDITDVYTETACTIIFAEGDDGSVAITNEDFSMIMEGEYLSNEDAIAYMGAAVAFIDQ